ncbi:hypothetical protein GCM10010464_32400 [Pseudonocardia yunnanensis]
MLDAHRRRSKTNPTSVAAGHVVLHGPGRVGRIWKAFELKPHRAEGFKLSNDPLFVEKVYDITGLYLDPPEAAVVLSVDEKSQVQALARSQPAFPMMPGMPEKRTQDYVRHGTTSLFAALNVEDGTVISALHRRHRAVEFRKFLTKIAYASAGRSATTSTKLNSLDTGSPHRSRSAAPGRGDQGRALGRPLVRTFAFS